MDVEQNWTFITRIIKIRMHRGSNANYRPRAIDREDMRRIHSVGNDQENEATRQVVARGRHPVNNRYKSRASTSHGAYNKTRVENFRKQQSQFTEYDLSEELIKKLFPGIKSMQSALDRLEATNTLKAITLCVTTGQIGFAISHIFISLRQFNNIPVAGSIYQPYRVGLALFEAKMLVIQRSVTITQENENYYETIPAN